MRSHPNNSFLALICHEQLENGLVNQLFSSSNKVKTIELEDDNTSANNLIEDQ